MNNQKSYNRGAYRGNVSAPRNTAPIPLQREHIKLKITANSSALSNIAPSNKHADHKIPEFHKIKDELNATKSKMDRYYLDPKLQKDFMNLLDIVRPTGALNYHLRTTADAQFVTRAWLKFYEIFLEYNMIKKSDGKVTAFMNAELPGAAICAFNHLMHTIYKTVPFDWYAASIASDTLNKFGDRYGLWSQNKSHWLMDNEIPQVNDGDATVVKNLLDYESRIGGKVTIATSDAGISVAETNVGEDMAPIEGTHMGFNMQEFLNAKIHLGCAVAAMITLVQSEHDRDGGSMVLKQYTFFETFTIDLIIIYASMFREFYVCKPMSSGQNNSETYLIGIGFTGFKHRDVLLERLANFTFTPFLSAEERAPFLAPLEKLARDLAAQQMVYINYCVDCMDRAVKQGDMRFGGVKKEMHSVREDFKSMWLKKYPVLTIDKKMWLASSYDKTL
jgi:cap2 methyltransferase